MSDVYLVYDTVRGLLISVDGILYKVISRNEREVQYFDKSNNLQSVSVGLLF